MVRILSTLIALVVAGATAAAQDHALTPTDLLEFGQVSATARLQLAEGSGDLKREPAFDTDVDIETWQAQFDAAVGLGMNFEVELSIPYQWKGTTETDGTFFGSPNVETEEEDTGFGDLQAMLNYRILKEDKTNPAWLIGFIVVAPTGNDKRGEAEVDAPFNIEGEEGGIGQGVWNYGAATSLSTSLGLAEPYIALSYVFGGDRDRNGVDEERADVGTLLVGAEFHATPQTTIDLRAWVNFVGDDVKEDNLVESEAEAHKVWNAAGSLYIGVAPKATLILGGGVVVPEDYEINTASGLELEGTFIWYVTLGLHIKLGL